MKNKHQPEREDLSGSLSGKTEKSLAGIDDFEKVQRLLKKQEYNFRPYFVEKVMSKIENLDNETETFLNMLFAFKRIGIPLLAAAMILLLFTIINTGSFSFESLLGLDSLNSEYLTEFLLFTY